jgi:hypothetical protein
MLGLSQEQLYESLVAGEVDFDLNHPGAQIAKGKAAFVALLRRVRQPVCVAFHAHKESVRDAAELVAIVAGVMLSVTGVIHEAVLPASVLVVKIGLEEVCRGVDGAAGHDS